MAQRIHGLAVLFPGQGSQAAGMGKELAANHRVARRTLEEAGMYPSFVAGHSLCEYSAHVVAGTLEFADAVRTVRRRGQFMQEAVAVGMGAMAAVLNLALESIRAACR